MTTFAPEPKSHDSITASIGQYLLKGWILTDVVCSTPNCGVPLMRSFNDKDKYICVRCSTDSVPPSKSSPANITNDQVSASFVHNNNEEMIGDRELEYEIANEKAKIIEDEKQARREQSEKATKLIGEKMLQGWALLNDSCINETCYGIPLLRNREKRCMCVVCGRYYVKVGDTLTLDSEGKKESVKAQNTSDKRKAEDVSDQKDVKLTPFDQYRHQDLTLYNPNSLNHLYFTKTPFRNLLRIWIKLLIHQIPPISDVVEVMDSAGCVGVGLIISHGWQDYLVKELPGMPANLHLKQYAGHIEIDLSSDAHIFFWLFERQIKARGDKLIVWLNGGPGCSSEDGIFLENGPYRMQPDLTLTYNEGTWNEYASVLFVDQPVGTGLSYAKTDAYVTKMSEVVDQFMIFFNKFLKLFPYYKNYDLYISGESFAGVYIPYITSEILKRNSVKHTYNIRGIAMGNPWISPKHQYQAYYTYSVEKGILKGNAKGEVEKLVTNCHRRQLKEGIRIHMDACENILQTILDNTVTRKNGRNYCINEYDIRGIDLYPSCGINWPFELKDITKYLRQKVVLKAIHAQGKISGWVECSSLVGRKLDEDTSPPPDTLLPNILAHIPVMIYSGDQDLICNHIGTKNMLESLEWNKARGLSAPSRYWYVNGRRAGTLQKSRNMTYITVRGGSHMVPYDRPKEMQALINWFIGVGELKQERGQLELAPPVKKRDAAEAMGITVLISLSASAILIIFCIYRLHIGDIHTYFQKYPPVSEYSELEPLAAEEPLLAEDSDEADREVLEDSVDTEELSL
ncbi:uncharacterized protein VTP21DRAFT_3194 [Calcarisporiella thermophila]|uniref:uncharacterized protein n=1 Tax=Calcarisporiella thermophila TaxID=911321 RepID=UPI003742F60E